MEDNRAQSVVKASLNLRVSAGNRSLVMHVTVLNRGDRSTTLTGLVFSSYTNHRNTLLKRRDASVVIPDPQDAFSLPYELKPGTVWTRSFEHGSDQTLDQSAYPLCRD